MAKGLFDKARTAIAKGEIDFLTDDIRAILVDAADHTLDTANDEFLDDIAAGARVATSGALASKTVTDPGKCDAANVVFSSVSGDQFELVVFYKHTGTESTSRLIAYDEDASGLPTTPNGQDITLTFHADGIYQI